METLKMDMGICNKCRICGRGKEEIQKIRKAREEREERES